MTTRRPYAFGRGARLCCRALMVFVAAAACGCLAGPEPIPPKEALNRAHQRITRLLDEERTQYPAAMAIESPEIPADPARIVVWYPSHPIIAAGLRRPGGPAAFEQAHPGLKLDGQFIGEWHVAVQKLTVALAAGDLPDIAVVERSWAARLAQAGRLMPLDGFLPLEVLDDIHPAARDAYAMQGRVWALPADGFCSVLFFNRDLVANAPETWDELRNAAPGAKAVRAIGYVPFVESLWSAGGRVCELNQSGLTAPAAMRTLEFLLELRDSGRTEARMLQDPAWGFSAFLNGDVAMTVGSSEWLPQTFDVKFPVGMAPVPGESGPVSRLGDMALVVFAKYAPAKRNGIVAVLDFLTGPTVQGTEAAFRGSMPVRQSVADTAEIPAGLREAYAAAQAPPFTGVWSAAEFELWSALELTYRWADQTEDSRNKAQ
ncbi:MAG TPA: extracellular solute-binding protein [Candidatus Hydrogenedentes bacterium]|nr:extracellular solute-binding protein [Candidatus Hydrogenedentota bacterium]